MDPTPEMTRRKLLLADDSVTIRKVVELTFAEEGIEVISAANGDEAMQRFVERTPDIVLVDVEMPGMSGYKICEMIKGDESTRDIPVLLLVGSFEPFDQDEAERVLADGFLTKPFHSIRELVIRVNELLDESSPRPAPETADIEDLYNSSFAQTMPLHEEITEEDLQAASYREGEANETGLTENELLAEEALSSEPDLGDPIRDDEMIETHPVSGEAAKEEFLEGPSIDDEMLETHAVAVQPVDEEFLDERSIDSEIIGTNTSAEELTGEGHFGEPPIDDDELVEAVHAAAVSENGYSGADGDGTQTPANAPGWGSPIDESEVVAGGAAAAAAAEGHHLSLVENVAVDPGIDDSSGDTEEIASPYATVEPFAAKATMPVPETTERPAQIDLTSETIELIARRVAEMLSDRIVREITQEVGPRSTEKVFREDLEEEGKT